MSEKTIKSEQMDRRQLEQFWNELKSEGMDCGYCWLDNIDHPRLCEHENMPDFPGNSRNFIVESCWYKENEKSVEIRFAGGKYIVTTVDLTKEKLEKPKEYFVATQEGKKILFSDIINEEDGSIKKIVFAGFGK